MRTPFLAWSALPLCLLSVPCLASNTVEIAPLGNSSYSLTCTANNKFVQNTDKLKAQALADADAYCATLHKQMKVVSATTYKPLIPFTVFISAKVVFKALDANDPELHEPAAAAAPTDIDVLYSQLLKLDDLRKRGLLTEEEFQAKRKELVDRSN